MTPPRRGSACGLRRSSPRPRSLAGSATPAEALRRRAGGLAAVLEGFPVLPRVEDFAGRAALELADDAVLGHEVDQPGGAAVADAQGALQERARAAALADDDLDGGLVQLVSLLQRRAAVLAPGPPLTWSWTSSRLNSTG